MKIEHTAPLDQAAQADRPFAKAKAALSNAQTAKNKADVLGKAFFAGQTGYQKEDLKKSAVEEFEEKTGGRMDAADRKKQMAVLANTMTPEDYRRAREAGFCVRSTAGETIVTVTDKIKATLARAGVDVSHMGGSLTKEQIEEIGGSLAAANQLQKCLEASDLPVTQENMSEGLAAISQANELAPLSEGAIKYLLDNRLLPTVENLYFAEFSGSASYVPPKEEADLAPIQDQMKQVILASGEAVNEKTLADGAWMVQNQIALTAENFTYMQKLLGLALPAAGEMIAAAAAAAIAEGGRPKDAMLLPEYTITAQAQRAVEIVTDATDEDLEYLVSNRMELTIENLEKAAFLRRHGSLPTAGGHTPGEAAGASGSPAQGADGGLSFLTAKRILEETRLAMTTEANRALLKKGISIDTKPLEALVEQLKEQEKQYCAALLEENGKAADAGMAQLFRETSQKVSDLKQMPAYALGMREYPIHTINGLHEAGSALKAALEKAGESYETLMTEPRKDLGDSMQKAFANVDDILADLGMEAGEENRRAVRILAYNRLSIDEESVLTMKAAYERVQRTFQNLTPAVVRGLIREGVNPLDMDFDALNQKAGEIRMNAGDDMERFSEYLWKLEQQHGISQQERESFIGVYRLMNQIEKTDGAAIGALVSQGAALTMRNLLTAARSAKKHGMEYTVDDDFAGIDAVRTDRKPITEQIETAYQADCMKDVMETLTPVTMKRLLDNPGWEDGAPEQLKQTLAQYAGELSAQEDALDRQYAGAQLEEVKQAAFADEEIYRFLSRYELPNTADHVLAASRFVNRRNQVFSRMFNSDGVFSDAPVDFEAVKAEILERFGDAVTTPKEMAAAQEHLAETAENVMKTMLADKGNITSMDVRELRLMHMQLSMAGKMAGSEEYTVPVLVGGEVTNLSLKIVRGEQKKGMVEILFETEKLGKVAASIEAKEDGVSGLIAADSGQTAKLFEAHRAEITKGFGEAESDLQVTHVSKLNFARFSYHANRRRTKDETEEGREIQTARLYQIAKGFLENIKTL